MFLSQNLGRKVNFKVYFCVFLRILREIFAVKTGPEKVV